MIDLISFKQNCNFMYLKHKNVNFSAAIFLFVFSNQWHVNVDMSKSADCVDESRWLIT